MYIAPVPPTLACSTKVNVFAEFLDELCAWKRGRFLMEFFIGIYGSMW